MKILSIPIVLIVQYMAFATDDFAALAKANEEYVEAMKALATTNLKLESNEKPNIEQKELVEEAKHHLELCLEVDPVHTKANYYLGRIYLAQKSYGQAQFYLERSMKTQKYEYNEYWCTYYNIICLYEIHKYDKALTEIEIFYRINRPNYSDPEMDQFFHIQGIKEEILQNQAAHTTPAIAPR